MTQSKMKKYVGILIIFAFVVTTIRLATSVEDSGISNTTFNRRLDVSIHPMRDISNQSETLVERSLRGVVKRTENNQLSSSTSFRRVFNRIVHTRMEKRAEMLEDKISESSLISDEEKRHLQDINSHPVKEIAKQSDTIIHRTYDGLVREGYDPISDKFSIKLKHKIARRMAKRAQGIEQKM